MRLWRKQRESNPPTSKREQKWDNEMTAVWSKANGKPFRFMQKSATLSIWGCHVKKGGFGRSDILSAPWFQSSCRDENENRTKDERWTDKVKGRWGCQTFPRHEPPNSIGFWQGTPLQTNRQSDKICGKNRMFFPLFICCSIIVTFVSSKKTTN